MKFQFTASERDIFRKPEDISTSQWAEKYRVVVRGPAQGKWKNELTPYCMSPMDALDLPHIREVFLCWGPQTGKTQVGINRMMRKVVTNPGPIMYVMSDEKVMDRLIQRQIHPTIRSTPKVARMLGRKKTDMSRRSIQFRNGADIMVGWASSAAVMASESVEEFFGDEPGKWPLYTGRHASPFDLVRQRLNAYPHTSKALFYSSPNEEADGFTSELNTTPDVKYRYQAKCLFCGHLQFMEFENIVFPKNQRDPKVVLRKRLARYQCAQCGMDWTDAQKNAAVREGAKHNWNGWVAVPAWPWEDQDAVPDDWAPPERPRAVGFHLPAWYSPWKSLSHAAAAFLRGLENPVKLHSFDTEEKAEPHKAAVATAREAEILARRCEFPPGFVPPEALAVTMGIDVQKRGFYFVARAWARDFSSWLIDYGYLSTWADVESKLTGRYPRIGGAVDSLPVWRAAIDTGGGVGMMEEWSRTEEVYHWIRRQPPGQVFGVKGASNPQIKRVRVNFIDKMANGKPIPGGLELRTLDTGAFKDAIQWSLMERRGGDSHRFYLHSETCSEYAAQMLAEQKKRDRKTGKIRWIQVRNANHYLDCEVYCRACIDNEWQPSFQILAAQMEARTKTAPPKPPAKPNSGPAVPGQRAPEENRGLW